MESSRRGSRTGRKRRNWRRRARWGVALLALIVFFILWKLNDTNIATSIDSDEATVSPTTGAPSPSVNGSQQPTATALQPTPTIAPSTPSPGVSDVAAGGQVTGGSSASATPTGSTGSATGSKPPAAGGGGSMTPITNGSGGSDSLNSTSTFTGYTLPNDPNRVKLTFVGDVLLGSTVENLLKANGYDYPYTLVKSYLEKADLTIANLETPITTRGAAQNKTYAYRSSPLALPALVASGVDLVNLANNHSMDYGVEGLLDTFTHLDQAGIKRVGAGKDFNEAYKPVIIESKGIKIAFLGFSRVIPDGSWKAQKNSPGLAETYDSRLPVEAISKAREAADLVVVIAHWGEERNEKPVDYQKDLAKRYIDAGADLIIGGHPHILQGFEQYKGKWIAYSLGNFIFTTNMTDLRTLDTAIVEASCSRERDCELNVVPVFSQWAKPRVMTVDESRKLFETLTRISFGAKVQSDGRVVTR